MKKKINHLSNFGDLGGVQSYLIGLKKYSSKEISLYTTRKPIEIYAESFNSVDIRKFNLLNTCFIDKREIFVIHNFILSKIWPILSFSQKIFKKPLIYHEHGIAWHSPINNLKKYQKRISKVDCIIANSKATASLLREIYSVDREINILRSPIFIYENNQSDMFGVPDDVYKSINKKNKIIIGYMGRLERHKNPIFLLKIANYLKSFYGIDVSVEFIGSGAERGFLENYAKQKKVKSVFHGLVKNRSIFVNKWDFAIFPSVREPLGLVQGEFASLNKLCLSSNVDGIPEVYPPNTNELLINMNKIECKSNDQNKSRNYQLINQLNKFDMNYYPDINDCAEKIVRLIKDPELCKSLLLSHKKFIYSNFSIENHFFKLNKILETYFIR